MTRKHDALQGHHNQSNPQSNKFADCKLPTCKDKSFVLGAVGNGDVAEVMGKTLDMMEGFISDILSESRDLKPAAVDENNNGDVERTNTELKPNNIIGAHVLEKKKE